VDQAHTDTSYHPPTPDACASGSPVSFKALATLLFVALLSACSSVPSVFDPAAVAPLQYAGQAFIPAEALAGEAAPDLLALDDEMREFVATYTGGIRNQRSRLMALHTAVVSPATLHVQYDPFADGSARQAFQRGTANCLSFANLFVAMAREAGLDARYQWIDLRPQWQRFGGRVALRLHVNVVVRSRNGEEFMVDIDPLRRHEMAGSHPLTDAEARALYHSNRAIAALSREEVVEAWTEALRALDLAPDMSHLWVNLGAIYRHAGQYTAAESAYFRALAEDNRDPSAMNNLVVLYEVTGRSDKQTYWVDRLTRHREQNPYHHAHLGDVAARENDWERAHRHYSEAVALQPDDSELIYGLAITEHRRGNFAAAERLILRAISKASFDVDQRSYRIQLESLKEERAASL
jgi:Flp pilus assembly protein TadD/uncharacterized protein YceK